MGLQVAWDEVVSGHSTADTLSRCSLILVAAVVLEGALKYRNSGFFLCLCGVVVVLRVWT